MLSIAELTLKYGNYSDEELFEIHQQVDSYSDDAKEALDTVIANRGGMSRLTQVIANKHLVDEEIRRISNETAEFGLKGIDASFIKTVTKSEILSEEQIKEVIEKKYLEVENEIRDKAVDSKTVAASFIGEIIASIISGAIYGVIIIQLSKIPIFLFALVLLSCYGIVILTTGKSKHNSAVFITTFISFLFALAIGQIIFQIAG